MAIDLTDIDVGTAANDGTGDPLRTAGQTINANNAILEGVINRPFVYLEFVSMSIAGGGTVYSITNSDLQRSTDADSLWNNATANAITVPSGVEYVKVNFSVGGVANLPNAEVYCQVDLRSGNNSNTDQPLAGVDGHVDGAGVATREGLEVSVVQKCVAGDAIRFRIVSGTSGAFTAAAVAYVEFIPT